MHPLERGIFMTTYGHSGGGPKVRIGVKELRDKFTKYLRLVKAGEEIIVTDRGRPVAVLSPLREGIPLEEKIEELARRGLVRPPKGRPQLPPPVKIEGRPISHLIVEERRREL